MNHLANRLFNLFIMPFKLCVLNTLIKRHRIHRCVIHKCKYYILFMIIIVVPLTSYQNDSTKWQNQSNTFPIRNVWSDVILITYMLKNKCLFLIIIGSDINNMAEHLIFLWFYDFVFLELGKSVPDILHQVVLSSFDEHHLPFGLCLWY